ncbi:hydrolase [Sutcliffiella horikoshii]|uniref:Hydrolase n=1 Tax=Sutcliffiella horikoshii TaxID=79883 RepID=A0A1Y0CJ38_9BACI|nr:metal-dependent hydrolase [Sutcliffiella horikoshii]ART75309.1 hydrolase [Sutcliffiella horikoshii]TYS58684.1 metal-dependent hydrolase [Sutcliffiella horikoshii]
MDTITHTLFGMTIFGAVDKRQDDKKTKIAMFVTAVGASQIPDSDVISSLWDTEGMYQMWHRGITHSLFMVPIWALLFFLLSIWFLKRKDWRFLFVPLIAVFIHNTADLFNAWGTGYLEPFSSIRVTFGTIPIVDFVIWTIIAIAFFSRKLWNKERHQLYRLVWILIIAHVAIQTGQGYLLYKQYEDKYEQVALSASFLPWHFSVIGRNEHTVEIFDDALFTSPKLQYTLKSAEEADLDTLFAEVPEAKTLYEWSPFVVIVDDQERLGIYDPRFYRNGQSFLFEYIEKQ